MNVRSLPQILRLTVPLALLTLLPLVSASAAPFSPITRSGVFLTDDAHGNVTFNLASDQTLYFYTTSYAGGPNADGTAAASGGFDPIVSLFNSTGTYVAFNDEDTTNYNRPKNGTGSSLDAYLAQNLTAGNYTLIVTQFYNFATSGSNINDPFSEDGNSNFTSIYSPSGTGMFYDLKGNQNTGTYTVNVSAAPPAVPEASTTLSLGLMLALGIGSLIVTARRRQVTAK
jgi:hypothetical protein